ncbi:MAG: dUTP diphosphatase [bacterium]|nr:dUTP diphosphatase [bacterium]
MKVKIKKIKPEAKLPRYAHPGDVGMDVFSLEDYLLKPGERKIFNCGFAMEFSIGYAAIIKDKSSLPRNHGLHTMGGVFDAGYRGEYNVLLINLGAEAYQIQTGEKIAQIIIYPIVIGELEEVTVLSDSARGDGAFGSTGKF